MTTTEPEKPVEKKRILIIDDSIVSIRTFTNILSPHYKVFISKSGEDGLNLLFSKNINPDLILLDYEMPEMDGPQTLEVIRAHDETKNIPVLFLTGVTDSEWIKRAISYSPDGYILKSVAPQELLKRIEGTLKSKKC